MDLGVCYYPEHWPESFWSEDFTRMKELGLAYVRIGEFAWSRYEPRPGVYQWDWLKRALDSIHASGLKAILGTPTATPPHWLVSAYPEVLALGPDGQTRGFGSRRHYCFSSAIYRELAEGIVTAMAENFGSHPALAAWQLDNEYGCHDTVISYSPAAKRGFQHWCRERYGSIEKLNEAWGNVFWSMEYENFAAIELPNLTVTEANPAHRLAFWRYSSDQVLAFNRMQAQILRRCSPQLPLVHNFMGFFTQFDHFALARDLDIASWDSYPLGFLDQSWADAATKESYLRTGHPDHTAFHHDLYRGVGRGRWWVMEQQPGPVNWAPHNPAPLPGMVRLWSWEAFAHGAELVSYFRWRQVPFAQEQFHAGLHLPNGERDQASYEVEELAGELRAIKPHLQAEKAVAEVALIFDYPSDWMLRIQPQGKGYDPLRVTMEFYEALRSLGVNIDVLPSDADLSPYRCIVLPQLVSCSPELIEKLSQLKVPIVLGPRTASKTPELSIPLDLPPSGMKNLIALRVERVESLPASLCIPLRIGEQTCFASVWREKIGTELRPHATFADGWGAWYQQEHVHYLAANLDQSALRLIFQTVLDGAGLRPSRLEGGLRLRRRGGLTFAFNYGPQAVTLTDKRRYLLGSAHLEPCGLAIWKHSEEE